MNEIAKFIAGFDRFQAKYFGGEQSLFGELRYRQHPRVLVIGCCDSRVDPALLIGASPGDLFVVRNVANLVPHYVEDAGHPGVRAAIEYAVKVLNVEHIIVLGHSRCGGIDALMKGEGVTEKRFEFVGDWVWIARRARERVLRELPRGAPEVQALACEHAAILVSLENLLSYSWIRERVDGQKLELHGWYFDMDGGSLLGYSAETSSFQPLAAR